MKASLILRDARRRAGLSQRSLAERAGVPQPAVARIESGRSVPRIDTLDRLLGACGSELVAAPRLGMGVDRTLIRELVALSARARLELAVADARALDRLGRSRRRRPCPQPPAE